MPSRKFFIASGLTATLAAVFLLKPQQQTAKALVPPTGTPKVALPVDRNQPKTSNGRRYPVVPTNVTELASLLLTVERALRDPTTPVDELPDLGHQQQVIYRVLSTNQSKANQVVQASW